MFLRKQSRNSLANWWSVCFKMFFSNGFICGVASTGSATVYENYFYALLFYFLNAKVLFFHYFFKYAKLAKFIRSEASWKLWRCEVEIFFFMKRFFTMLRFVQNDTVLFFYSRLGIWIILNAKIFYYSYIFKEAKWEFASELMKRVF